MRPMISVPADIFIQHSLKSYPHAEYLKHAAEKYLHKNPMTQVLKISNI